MLPSQNNITDIAYHIHNVHSIGIEETNLYIGLAAAAVSVLTKEWIFRITKDAAVKTRSPVLMANAWHHRTDGLSSLVAIAGILGTISFLYNYDF